MQSFMRCVRQPWAAFRALVLVGATLAIAVACDEQDRLPTGPPSAVPPRAQATIVGANTIVLPTLGGVGTSARSINDAGEVAGSVSGGCVEGAVVTEALNVLDGTRERGVISFGYSDDEAFAVGLTCGGTIHLFVEPLDW